MQQKALVVGLGASGEACTKFLLKRQWQVRATDTRSEPPALSRLSDTEGFSFVSLQEAQAQLKDCNLLVMSPGISPWHSAVTPLVRSAQSLGIEIVGEIELFARELLRLKSEKAYEPKVIAVTGTNGKTTTTVLTTKMAAASGLKAVAAGNIGPNAVTELDRYLESGELPDVWVLELSSFQLETTSSLAPDAAALLNITQDHLDWHGGMNEYVAAKGKIFAHEKTARILNRDDTTVMNFAAHDRKVFTFGATEPQHPNEWGLVKEDGIVWLAFNEDDSVQLTKRKVLEGHVLQRLMPEDALHIRGRHNSMNALAALALIYAAGLPISDALRALAQYRGEPHRVEYVMTVNGVDYIDDSKGTNVGATVAALEGLGANGTKLVVILGGDGKGQDFSPIADSMGKHARAAVLIGRDAPLIEKALQGAEYPIIHAKDMPQAVQKASELAQPHDCVLLSPACASWDMFKDYAQRSAIFIASAKALAGDTQQ
ncbi:UDP-N-acetylmuramoyl-L-alanine--D-glutamate ligase [Parasutterella secunda]|uniref:UDP-N-acetylmuramoyl-L-alanine--D-glutamate ligase n=1 Tax=Parasutterella secunda TaxID=626947 RepID=UPI0025A435F6|nr:UDP-N-acetylmuramoyl-L-alanine--D-glutamate ligase [Parasutterella secunda]MDM8218107.1 UDP-N-acetylmuramoyl-L-alanine--D-glutamate ligase [Parasutterella secunda]